MARVYNNWGFQQGNGYPSAPRRNSYRDNYKAAYKKHSGAKFREGESNGKPWAIVYGWNYSKERGMISFIASPYSKTKVVTGKSGRKWANWFVKITHHRTMQITKTSGLFDIGARKLHVPDFGMIANPGAPNGGYFGTFKKR
jgi:hypothetical protein